MRYTSPTLDRQVLKQAAVQQLILVIGIFCRRPYDSFLSLWQLQASVAADSADDFLLVEGGAVVLVVCVFTMHWLC
jgi:hypothetical protein